MKYTVTGRRILFEVSDQEAHDYATTQAVLPAEIVELVRAAQGKISKDDLHADGFGPEPHITVLYGLDDADKDKAMAVMRDAGPCRVRVRGVDLFQNDDQDVVLFAVDSEDLARLHDALDQEIPENANRWPEYKPHMTVAYVLPGKGEAYKDLESELVGREFDIDALEFSDTQDHAERVDLRGEPVPTEGVQKIREESPLFGTDIVEDPEDPGVRDALYPILNRSNRRAVSARQDGEGMSVLLDNGDNLVVTRGPNESWSIAHKDKTFDTSKLGDIEALATRLRSPTEQVQEQGGEDPEWMRYSDPEEVHWFDDPPEEPADVDAPPEEPAVKPPKKKRVPRIPQSKVLDVHNVGYRVIVNVAQPTGHRSGGQRFDRVDDVIKRLHAMDSVTRHADINRASANAVVVDVNDHNLVDFKKVMAGINGALGASYEIRDNTTAPKPTLWQRLRGKVADDVSEDTFTSDVGFTDTIPITRGRRRKVSLPGLSKVGGKRRRVTRRYDVKESMSKGTSPILVVLRPQQVAALDAKPVWSALRESGVINARPFKMGEEPFVEVRIDTLRKEWTQANAGVLLDEVGSIDPRIQRSVMEGFAADTLADVVKAMLPVWCGQVPVDVAIAESESYAAAHRAQRLAGKVVDEEWARAEAQSDAGVARRVLEWYGLSRDVLERLASIDATEGDDRSFAGVAKRAAKTLLEQETTDSGAGIGAAGSGMPSGNPMGAATQGYADQGTAPPALPGVEGGVSVSSRNWPAQGMFQIHVLVGDTPQWVYRQVVGHEGEGEQSLLVYRTPEGRVMRMPHEQIDAATGFGAVVSPEELQGTTPGEEPVPTFPSPEGEPPAAPQVAAIPANMGEQANPDQERLTRDTGFSKALAQYQQSKDEKDWELVRKEAERATGKKGADVDAMLAPFAEKKAGEKQPMYGGAYEQIVPPEGVDESRIPPQFRSKLDNKAAKKKREAKKDESLEEQQAAAIQMFAGDEQFHSLMNKFESTRNEGYLLRASERAARVAGIPLREARSLVDEILAAAKK